MKRFFLNIYLISKNFYVAELMNVLNIGIYIKSIRQWLTWSINTIGTQAQWIGCLTPVTANVVRIPGRDLKFTIGQHPYG